MLISFFMQWFIRWADNEDLEHGDRQFGGTEWRQVADVPTEHKRRWLIDRYLDRLHGAGFKHPVWFELIDDIRDWTLQQTVFLPTGGMKVLTTWRSEGRRSVDMPGKLERRAPITLHDAPPVETTQPPQQEGLF